MFFHAILTGECNSQCRYCFGEAMEDTESDFEGFDIDYSLPSKINYDVEELRKFCEKDPECVLTFYGGEPLLRMDDIRTIMNHVNVRHFMMQTNGLLLDQLESKYVNRFHTILVSIDGNEALTNFYRGPGTYEKVIANMKLIRHNGFAGELIARMTVMEQTDVYEAVTWLLDNPDFPFSSIHWQLNAGFWKNDFARRDFGVWSQKNYNPGVRRLVKFWVSRMASGLGVAKLYPILGIAQSLLKSEKNALLRCGAGWTNYAIQTDGHLIICPNMWGVKNHYLGHISSTFPCDIPKIFVGNPCTNCNISEVCGGRCLYANITRRWGPSAYALVCDTVRNLVDAVTKELPHITELINSGDIGLADFEYVKYNGCEIIP